MAKKARPTLGAAPRATQLTLKEQGRGMLGPLGALFGALPGQVRLAAREQQPRPPVPPKKRRGR
jgi:hypothetical protein